MQDRGRPRGDHLSPPSFELYTRHHHFDAKATYQNVWPAAPRNEQLKQPQHLAEPITCASVPPAEVRGFFPKTKKSSHGAPHRVFGQRNELRTLKLNGLLTLSARNS